MSIITTTRLATFKNTGYYQTKRQVRALNYLGENSQRGEIHRENITVENTAIQGQYQTKSIKSWKTTKQSIKTTTM